MQLPAGSVGTMVGCDTHLDYMVFFIEVKAKLKIVYELITVLREMLSTRPPSLLQQFTRTKCPSIHGMVYSLLYE